MQSSALLAAALVACRVGGASCSINNHIFPLKSLETGNSTVTSTLLKGCLAKCSQHDYTTDTPAPLYCTEHDGVQFYGTEPPSQETISHFYTEEHTGYRSGRIKEGDVVFDIGPYLGYFTLKASQLVGATGRVVSIEASLINYNVVKKMIECNRLGNVDLVYGAAYSEDGKQMHIHSQRGRDAKNVATVGNTVAEDWQMKKEVQRHWGRLKKVATEVTERAVTSVTVDALKKRLALPKVDHIFSTINGVEMDALIGAQETILADGPEIVLADRALQVAASKDTPDLKAWLQQHGYLYFRNKDIVLGPYGDYDNGTLFGSKRKDFLKANGYV